MDRQTFDKTPNFRRGSVVVAALIAMATPVTVGAQTIERITTSGAINLGYEADAAPFAFDTAGVPAGYAVRLCQIVAETVKEQLALPELAVNWVPVATADRTTAVQSGQVDLICGAVPVTLTTRAEVSFSIPIFPSGIGGLVNSTAPKTMVAILSNQEMEDRPIWRGAPARTFLDQKTFSVVEGSTTATWLDERIGTFDLASTVATVPAIADGIAQVQNGEADVVFGDIATLLAAANAPEAAGDLRVLPRYFTHEPVALALARNDDDFRLAVDRALSLAYRSEAFDEAFVEYFGEPAEPLVVFFDQTALPD